MVAVSVVVAVRSWACSLKSGDVGVVVVGRRGWMLEVRMESVGVVVIALLHCTPGCPSFTVSCVSMVQRTLLRSVAGGEAQGIVTQVKT